MLSFERIFNVFYHKMIKIVILSENYSIASKAILSNKGPQTIDKRQLNKIKSTRFYNNQRVRKLT